MRVVHGSMMDAVGARPGDLLKANRRLVSATQFDGAHPKRLPLQWAPVARAATAQNLVQQMFARQSQQAVQAVSALPALAFNVGAVWEAMALAQAATTRWIGLQAQWVNGLTELGQEMSETRQPNTVAKYVDQENNLVRQGMALVSGQVAAAAQLAENIQVDVGWWLHQQATARE